MSDRDPVSHRPRRPAVVMAVPDAWPSAAREWLVATRADWVAFGETDLAGLVKPGDLPSLRYLFELRDRRLRYLRASKGGNALGKGSMGQDVANPLMKLLPSLDREIRALENQFGMNPMSRRRLLGEGAEDPSRPTLAQLLDAVDGDDAENDRRSDPRLTVLRAEGSA